MGIIGDYLSFQRNKGYAAEQAQQVGGLLDQYRQAPDQNALPLGNNPAELDQSIMQQQGGFKQPGGLLGNMPPSEFYLKAATIPGLTQPMLTQAQQQQGAMDRQVQEQTFRQSNMTASELANYTLQQERLRVDQERFDKQFTELSAYQKAMLGRMGSGGAGAPGQGGTVFGAPPSGYSMTIDPATGQPVLTPMAGGKEWADRQQDISQMTAAVGALDTMIDFVKRKGTFETGGESAKISSGARQNVISGLSALNNMGVLQPGELEYLLEQVPDPSAWKSALPWNTQESAIGKLQGVRERFIQGSKAAQARMQGTASAPPPPPGFKRAN